MDTHWLVPRAHAFQRTATVTPHSLCLVGAAVSFSRTSGYTITVKCIELDLSALQRLALRLAAAICVGPLEVNELRMPVKSASDRQLAREVSAVISCSPLMTESRRMATVMSTRRQRHRTKPSERDSSARSLENLHTNTCSKGLGWAGDVQYA